MARGELPRLAVLGAGPVGIEAGLYAGALNLPFTIYDRGDVGHFLNAWGHVRLFTPWGWNTTPLGRASLRAANPRGTLPGDADLLTGREHRAAYLVPLVAQPPLAGNVRTKTLVVAVGRREGGRFRLLLRDEKGQERVEEADLVLDCTGTYGDPRHLGEGGIPAIGETAIRDQIAWGLEDIAGDKEKHYAEKTVLVVGAGTSAATTVCLLAALAGKYPSTWTYWVGRGPGSTPLKRLMNDPLRERDHLMAKANNLATRGEGNVEYRPSTVVEAIEPQGKEGGHVVRLSDGDRPLQVDRIIANVGYEPSPMLARALADGEPGYHVLGIKAQARAGQFLLKQAFEQLRDTFARIVGKPGLDLYRKA